MTVRGVLLDFSGTLFHLEPGEDDELLTTLVTAPVIPSEFLPAELADDWERRDLDTEIHRRVYLAALRAAGWTEQAEAIYERIPDPASWQPYPDTECALRRLAAAGVPVAVVSNIPWDIRPVFRRHGVEDLVGEYVLSYAEGVMKPAPKIFLTACQRIGVAAEHTLMIGDSAVADGAAADVGCRFALVEALHTTERPDALLTTLAAHGLGET